MRQLIYSLIFIATCSAGIQADERPNVLFIFMDDQQADTIAALGNQYIQTPNLDRLVKRGVSFDRAYMQGGMNGATCVPSRAMLLSGRSLFHIDEKLLKHPTWPAAFARSGYTTFISGKWHNGEASLPRCFQEAKSIFAGGMTNPLKAKLSNMVDGNLTTPANCQQHACAQFADEAIEFIKRQHQKPFFCYLPFDGPHDPHIVPDSFTLHYDAQKIPLPANFLPQHPWNNGEMLVRDEALLSWPRNPDQVREMIAEYYRYISYLDQQIGRVLDALEASPSGRNTIIVFSADSGVARGQHGLIGKQNCYEHSLRVPLVIAGPGIVRGQWTHAMCYLFDVMPTLGKLCSVPSMDASEGLEFSAVLKEPGKSHRPVLVFAYKNVQRAIRDNHWKLIRYPLINKNQLFDLQTDPFEIKNLAEIPEHRGKVNELISILIGELKMIGDVAPLTVSNPLPPNWNPVKVEKK